jgi:hypothetical protein
MGVVSEEEKTDNVAMAVSPARRGFPGMNRAPRPTTQPTQKSWLAISIKKMPERNRK